MKKNFSLGGTLIGSFKIGENGATIYSSTTAPGPSDGTDGDLFIVVNGGSSQLFQKVTGWAEINSAMINQLASLTPSSDGFIVGDGSAWEVRTGSVARDSLGLGTGDSPVFDNLDLAGGFVVGAPTGGNQGTGTINVEQIFLDGTSLGTSIVTQLNDLSDVSLAGVAAGQILFYNGTDWINASTGTASGVQAYDADLNTIASLAHANNNVIKSNGTNWTSAGLSFDDLSNVNVTTAVLGDFLTYDGAQWINTNNLSVTMITTTMIQRGVAGAVSLFADAGANNISLGGTTSTIVIDGDLQVNGTTTTIDSQTLQIADKNIVVNHGGNTASSTQSGIDIEGDSGAIVGYFRVASTNDKLELKASTGNILTLDINADTTLILGTGTAGQTIAYNGTNWINDHLDINDLGDVVITGPSSNQILTYDGTNWINSTVSIGTGDVNGPGSSGDNSLVRFNGTTGKTIQNSNVAIDDLGNVERVDSSNVTFGLYALKNATTDNTQTELFLNGTSGTLTIPNNSTVGFKIKVVARRTDATNESAMFRIDGVIDRQVGAGSTALVDDVEIVETKDSPWVVDVIADTTAGGISILVTGENAKDINWTAFVELVGTYN